MPTLACLWLSIHFDEYLVLCGYSLCIFGQLVSFVDHCIFGWLATSFRTLCKCYFDQVTSCSSV